MKLHAFDVEQVIPVPLQEAWAFFSDAANLARITPPELGLSPTNELPPRMYPGMIVSYRVRPFPLLRSTWVTEITHVQEPTLFIDEQRFGPYRFWHHQHHFEAVEGGTRVRDLVHYALPLEPLSAPFARWLVRPQLERIFDYRRKALEEIFAPRGEVPRRGVVS